MRIRKSKTYPRLVGWGGGMESFQEVDTKTEFLRDILS